MASSPSFAEILAGARTTLEYAVSAHADESRDFNLAAEQLRELSELRRKAAAWDALQEVAQAALDLWANREAFQPDNEDWRRAYDARSNLRRALEYHE